MKFDTLAQMGGGSWFIGALLVLFGAIGFIKDMSIRRALNEIRSELMSV